MQISYPQVPLLRGGSLLRDGVDAFLSTSPVLAGTPQEENNSS